MGTIAAPGDHMPDNRRDVPGGRQRDQCLVGPFGSHAEHQAPRGLGISHEQRIEVAEAAPVEKVIGPVQV